jgi:hypothetical protein
MGLTSVATFAILKLVSMRKKYFNQITYRQSSVYELVKNFIPEDINKKQNKITQLEKHIEKTNMKVVIVEGQAYWILNNVFYTGDLANGILVQESSRKVDTSNMSQEEIDKMLFILDHLRNGLKNDSGDSRN